MIHSVQIRPEAEIDIEEAAFWYQKQFFALGNRFLNELERTIQNISENPNVYPKVYKEIRRALLRKFPFAIFCHILFN